MTKKINWPPHREIEEYRWSDLESFRPAVAKAMRAQGMDTAAHITDRIEYAIEYEGIQKELGLSSCETTTVLQVIQPNDKPSTISPFRVGGQGFKKIALAVAFALEARPVDLFGDPMAPENYVSSKSERKGLNSYRPKVADAMLKAGIYSAQELHSEMMDFLKNPAASEFFGGIRPDKRQVQSLISKNKNGILNNPFHSKGGFTLTALLISFVLRMAPRDLFGAPLVEENLSDPFLSACDELEDVPYFPSASEVSGILGRDEAINEALLTLHPEKKEVIMRFYGLGGYKRQTIKEIAESLDLKPRTVKERLFNTRRDLADLNTLREYYEVDPELSRYEHLSISLD